MEGLETETKRIARETQQKEDADTIARGETSTQARPISEKIFMHICKWWKKGGRDTKKSRISLCMISWHKLDKDERMEDEE
jgi:hypothetical protein